MVFLVMRPSPRDRSGPGPGRGAEPALGASSCSAGFPWCERETPTRIGTTEHRSAAVELSAGDDGLTVNLACDPAFGHDGDPGLTCVEVQVVENDVVESDRAGRPGPRHPRRPVTVQLVGDEARAFAAALGQHAGDASAAED